MTCKFAIASISPLRHFCGKRFCYMCSLLASLLPVFSPQIKCKMYLDEYSVCSEMTGQWSDRSAMSSRKTLSPPDPMNYLRGLALKIWTSFWRREGSAGMDMCNTPMVQSRQLLTYRLMESVGLGGPRWHGSSWQTGTGIAKSGSSRLLTLMTDIPGDLVWDLPCMQQASYLEGGPLMWMLPCAWMLIKNQMMMMSKFKHLLYTKYIRKAYYEIIKIQLWITDETAPDQNCPN